MNPDDGVGDSSRLSSVVTAIGPNSARNVPTAGSSELPFLGHAFPLLAVAVLAVLFLTPATPRCFYVNTDHVRWYLIEPG